MNKAEKEKIRFHFLVKPFHFPDRSVVKGFIQRQLKAAGKSIEAINYVFCDDAYLLEINEQYLKHDTYTDIITFELSPKDQPILADIYISIDRVRENAKKFEASTKRELHRVIFHGVLHLIGYRDKTSDDQIQMRQQEDIWLEKYFVSRETNAKNF